MAEQVAAGEPISTLRPFAHRVALPFLAGTLFPHDIAFGFELLNLVFAVAAAAVFCLFLRCCQLRADTGLLLVLALVCASQSPYRFVHFIPAYADPPALFFIVMLLYLGRPVSGRQATIAERWHLILRQSAGRGSPKLTSLIKDVTFRRNLPLGSKPRFRPSSGSAIESEAEPLGLFF